MSDYVGPEAAFLARTRLGSKTHVIVLHPFFGRMGLCYSWHKGLNQLIQMSPLGDVKKMRAVATCEFCHQAAPAAGCGGGL